MSALRRPVALVVDDEDDMRELLGFMLDLEGFEVRFATRQAGSPFHR